MKSTRFTERLKIYSVGKRIPTLNYSLTKEIGTNTANGLALVEFKFMTTSVHSPRYL